MALHYPATTRPTTEGRRYVHSEPETWPPKTEHGGCAALPRLTALPENFNLKTETGTTESQEAVRPEMDYAEE